MADDMGASFGWSELVPGGVVIYYADGDEEIVHVNQYVLDLFECADFDEFVAHTGGSFRGFVHGADLDANENSFWAQANKRNGLDHIYYQVQSKGGRILSVDDYGRLVERPGERPLFYVLVVEMERDSVIDWLTGLPGLERFFYLAKIEAQALAARGEAPALVVFDLMGMKTFNALNGRTMGDELLCTFATILRHHFGGELCCRHDGDSFCTIAPADKIEELVSAVFDDLEDTGSTRRLPVMAGACVVDEDDDLTLALDRAKIACDSDRSTYESHLSWYTDSMREDALTRAYVLDHIDEAIDKGWVRPYYQGLVRTASNAVCGEEALARWVDPNLGFLSPAQFIPTLEDAGLLTKLDLHIIDCVLMDMGRKRDAGVPLVPVSVNVSLRDLGRVSLAERVARKADELRLPHDLLCIEFTESAATTDPEALQVQVHELHAAGFRVWMDDFGSGFSSLNNLGTFDFDLIKLDMGFLYENEREKSRVIIDGVIRSAKRMGLRTLAEGVERRGQADMLRDLGCDVQQGFRYFRPQPLDEVISGYYAQAGRRREPEEERAYWDAVSSVSLSDLAGNNDGKGVSERPTAENPAGVCELRDGTWWMLRANAPLCDNLVGMGLRIAADNTFDPYDVPLRAGEDESFQAAVERARRSGTWERVSNFRQQETGFQFYISPLATCAHAEAFVLASAPNMLGAALGNYGDVPVGYAVLRVVKDASGQGIVDAEYVYANDNYRRYGDFGKTDLTAKTLVQDSSIGGAWLLPYCYRAAVEGEMVQEVVYSEKTGHWLSLSVAPSPVPDCCVLAFTLADAEHREREEMTIGLETSDLIIAIADALNTERDYNDAMDNLLVAMSQVIHPDRLYIYERDENTMSNTFEWCAPGVESQIEALQDMRNEDFEMWERLLSRDAVVMIPNVEELAESDSLMYEHLRRQDIDRMLAVPLYAGRQLIGYIGADNYQLEEGLDTRRLLETVASFAGARIANQRLVAELEHLRVHDTLTGALNRTGIDLAIEECMREHPGRNFLLSLVDVDDFRTVNDLYGRAVGDETLRQMVAVLKRTFPRDAVIGRNGTSEALVALFGDSTADAAVKMKQLLEDGLVFEYEGRRYSMTLSAGSTWCQEGDNLSSAYTRADEALYDATLAGRSVYREWTPAMGTRPLRAILGLTTRDLTERMPLAMLVHRPDGEILYANEGLPRLLGYSSLDKVFANVGRSMRGIVRADDWERFVAAAKSAIAGGPGQEEYEMALRVVDIEGRELRVSYNARYVQIREKGAVVCAFLVERG